MVLKKMKNRMLSILLTAAVAITAYPSVPVMAMPESSEEAYVSGDELLSDNLEQINSEDILPGSAVELTEGEQQGGASKEETSSLSDTPVPEEETPSASDTPAPRAEMPSSSDASVPEEEVSSSVEVDSEQQSEESEISQNSKEYSETVNMDIKAVGSNGIAYEDVAYLSARAYNSLPEDAQKVYMDMCDSITEWKENGEDVQDIVLSVDEDGELALGFAMPIKRFDTADTQQFIDGVAKENTDEVGDTKDAIDAADIVDKNGEETNKDTNDADKEEADNNADTENKEETGSNVGTEGKEESGNNADTEGKEETDNNSGTENKEDSNEGNGNTGDSGEADGDSDDANQKTPDSNADSDSNNDVTDPKPSDSENDDGLTDGEIGEAEEPSNMEVEGIIGEGIISENVELMTAYNDESQYIYEMPAEDLNTLLPNSNENYFKNQLDSNGKLLYDAGKKSYITDSSKGYIGYTLTTSTLILPSKFSIACCDSISALINMYPNYFNWLDLGASTPMYGKMEYKNGRGKYTVGLAKSDHYNTNLETQATARVNELVDKAVQHAVSTYPTNPTYGIIEYFDKWICETNFYNYVGTYGDPASLSSDTYFYCHSCYGILLKGYGVCESYALAMSRLLDAAGIRNQYIMGDAGGGHAWNYVQMPDNQWYLLDSTWDDPEDKNASSTKDYFLVCDDGIHKPTGKRFKNGKTFKFEKRSKASYVEPDEAKIVLKPKGKYNLSVKDSYYSKMVTGWNSDNAAVAKVDKDGQITAGTKAGQTKIKMTMKTGSTYSIDVYVEPYQITSLTFPQNDKASYTDTYADEDAYFSVSDVRKIDINVTQKDKKMTAEELQKCASLPITVTSGNTKVAVIIDAPVIDGDTIKLNVYPINVGKSKITIKFGGKSASYTLNVKYALQESWFSFESDSKTDGYTYTGKAYKPKVTKTATSGVGKNAKYKVTYVNNKNAGTAKDKAADKNVPTVKITGTGNYAGTIERHFTINPISPTGTIQFVSCAESLKYNGAGQQPKTKVKMGNKTLKAGADYVLVYKPKDEPDAVGSEEMPQNVGTYIVTVKGNNYDFPETTNPDKPMEFKIVETDISKVKVSCPSSIKATGDNIIPNVKKKIAVKIGKNVLEEGIDYTVTFKDSADNTIPTITEKGTYKVVFAPTGDNVKESAKKKSIIKTLKVK